MAKRRKSSGKQRASNSRRVTAAQVDLQAKIDEVMQQQQAEKLAAAERALSESEDDQEAPSLTPGQIAWRVIGWVVWIVAVWLLSSLMVSALIVFMRSSMGYNALGDTIGAALMQVLQLVLMLVMVVGIPYKLGKNKLLTPAKRQAAKMKLLGIGRLPSKEDVLPWLLGVVGYYLLAFILTALASLVLPDSLMTQAQYTGFNANSWGGAILIVFILAIITPIFEELIFRGFLLGKLQRLAGFWPTAIITSLLFAVAHGQVNVGLVTFVLSMITCYQRKRTGATWAGMGLHMVVNLVAASLVFIMPLMA